MEGILLGLVVIGGVLYVTGFHGTPDASEVAYVDLGVAGEDALTLLAGVDGCAEFEGARKTSCTNSYGERGLKRFITEAVHGKSQNLSLRLKTLLPEGVQWNMFIDTGAGAHVVSDSEDPQGQRAATSLPFVPEWNLTVVAPAQSPLASSGAGHNNGTFYALPEWKSRALALGDDGALPLTFSNGDNLGADEVLVDADRGFHWLRAHWRFDEAAGKLTTERRRGASITVDESQWTAGRTGSALGFFGTGSGFQHADARLAVDTLTLQAWVHPSSVPSGDALLVKYATGKDVVTIEMAGTTGHPLVRVDLGGVVTASLTAADPLALNTWTHVAVTLDGERALLYVNGTLAAAADAAGAFTGTSPSVTVGHLSGSTATPYHGRLDDVRVYGRALEATDWSVLRRVVAQQARSGVPGWDPVSTSPRVVESAFVHGLSPFPGRTEYHVRADATLDTLTPVIQGGLNASYVAAYANATGSRLVSHGAEVAVEANFTALVDALEAAGAIITQEPVTRVTILSPVTQAFESRDFGAEVANASVGRAQGYYNTTVRGDWLLGTHVTMASLTVGLELQDGPQTLVFRQMDYVEVAPVRVATPPANPIYRAVLELWIPEWG